MSVSLETLRAIQTAGGLNVNTTDYPLAQQDYALHVAANYARRHLRLHIEKSDDFTLSEGDADIDLCTLAGWTAAEFHVGQVVHVGIGYSEGLEITDRTAVFQRLKAGETGEPEMIYFEGANLQYIAPIPNTDYTAHAVRVPPIEVWAFGTGSPGGVSIDIPFEVAEIVGWYLGPAVLQHRDPEVRFGSNSWQVGLQLLNDLQQNTQRPYLVKPGGIGF